MRGAAIRFGWLGAAPLLLTFLALRYLVPGRGEVGPGVWGWLAGVGDRHPVPLAVGLFVLFGLLVRQFADRLPGGEHIVSPGASRSTSSTRGAGGWLVAVLGAAAAAVALRVVVGQPYRVASASMLPTFEPSDYLLVSKRGPAPRRGDPVVFQGRAVGETGEALLVKRVIGLPGDKVDTSGGLVRINGWQVPYCDAGRYVYLGADQTQTVAGRLVVEFLDDRAFLTLHTPEAAPFEGQPVPAGQMFLLGDNRNASRDSRAWNGGKGAGVPLRALEGRAWRVVSSDGDGHLGLPRAPGLGVHLPGIDLREVEQRIARCLEKRPLVTSPPPPRP